MTQASHAICMASLQHKLDVILGPRRSLSYPDDLVPNATDESSEGPFLPDAVALVNSTEEIPARPCGWGGARSRGSPGWIWWP